MPRFVIQQHDATSLHYDFRLEIDGTLKSWAVPKGPSTDPAEKRLAVEVPDHALSHLTHESDNVIVWDTGTYDNLDDTDALPVQHTAGHIKFFLHGTKLTGGWTLHRTHAGAKPQWLLIKRRDPHADATLDPVSTQPESVLSGRTIDDR